MRAKKANIIKIGYSTNVKDRHKAISQCFIGAEVELLAVAEGNLHIEKTLHKQFSEHLASMPGHREWFVSHDKILALIERVKADRMLFIGDTYFPEQENLKKPAMIDDVDTVISRFSTDQDKNGIKCSPEMIAFLRKRHSVNDANAPITIPQSKLTFWQKKGMA